MTAQLTLFANRRRRSRLKILASGDPKTQFRSRTAAQIYEGEGAPPRLLTSSAKSRKAEAIGVLNRILFFTPGVFCPASTEACRAACLGHTSGNMQLPSSSAARDQRSAFYVEDQDRFLLRLRGELAETSAAARRRGQVPAVRLNGTSDLPWERLHPELFAEFPEIQFFDYTKLRPRFAAFLRSGDEWPRNYHLTFSGDGRNGDDLQRIASEGGNVALVFWPVLPAAWRGIEVIDGDLHDARFLDPRGVIVGLRAKGIARVDLSGFVERICPYCPNSEKLSLQNCTETTHRELTHNCPHCGFEDVSRWILPHALKCHQHPLAR